LRDGCVLAVDKDFTRLTKLVKLWHYLIALWTNQF
jgi:hypothetical protein